MLTRTRSVFVVAMSIALVSSASALVELPDPHKVEFRIHETPSEPSSAVVMRITVTLVAAVQEGDSIGWLISAIQFRQPGSTGGADLVWTALAPTPDTPDGHWWITHADASDPESSEFIIPPHVSGTAISSVIGGGALTYDFEGHVYTPPSGGAPYDMTGSLDYEFSLPTTAMLPRVWTQPVHVPGQSN